MFVWVFDRPKARPSREQGEEVVRLMCYLLPRRPCVSGSHTTASYVAEDAVTEASNEDERVVTRPRLEGRYDDGRIYTDQSGPQRGASETEATEALDLVEVTGRHPTSHPSSAHQQQRAAKKGTRL